MNVYYMNGAGNDFMVMDARGREDLDFSGLALKWKKTHTRTIKRIAKVFDVSPVSFPANPGTELSVSTRDYFNGVIEAERAERLEAERREKQKQKIRLLTEI